MIAEERRRRILAELALSGRVEVASFADRSGAADITIRRDLVALEAQGLLRRVHGGAVLPDAPDTQETTEDALRSASPSPLASVTIGVVLPATRVYENYREGIIRGARRAAAKLGIRLLVSRTSTDIAQQLAQMARMRDLGASALLCMPIGDLSHDRAARDAISALHERVPVVLLECYFDWMLADPPIDGVSVDHGYGIWRAIDHLRTRGIERYGIYSVSIMAWQSVRQSHADARVKRDVPQPAEVMQVAETEFLQEGTAAIAGRFLAAALAAELDGVIVHPPFLAAEFVRLARERGLSIPEDLAVITYADDLTPPEYNHFSRVVAPSSSVGVRALQLAVARLAGRAGAGAEDVRLRPNLIRGATA